MTLRRRRRGDLDARLARRRRVAEDETPSANSASLDRLMCTSEWVGDGFGGSYTGRR